MNREEILSASRKQNTGMDEKAHFDYQKAYVLGAAVSICIASIFIIVEAFNGGTSFGYVSIVMAQFGITGLIFGTKSRDTSMGKLFLISGIVCLIAFLFNFILYFYNMFR